MFLFVQSTERHRSASGLANQVNRREDNNQRDCNSQGRGSPSFDTRGEPKQKDLGQGCQRVEARPLAKAPLIACKRRTTAGRLLFHVSGSL